VEERGIRYHLSNRGRKLSEKPLTSGRMSNGLPSCEQYGAQTDVTPVDEWKNKQQGAISGAKWYINREHH